MNKIDAGPFSQLVEWLRHIGFIVLGESTDDERFGNSLLLLRRGDTRIRVVRDRSQWFIEMASSTSDAWFSPIVWLAALDGTMPPARTFSDDEQAQIIRDRLEGIDLLSSDPSNKTIDLLTSWQGKRAALRRAQPPGTQ
jgi:hypothetical protein